MKTVFLSLILLMSMLSISFAGNRGYNWGYEDNRRPYKDSWGNNYKYQQNLYKDTDRDGVINMYDYNDRNPRIQNPYQYDYNNIYKPKNNYRNRR